MRIPRCRTLCPTPAPSTAASGAHQLAWLVAEATDSVARQWGVASDMSRYCPRPHAKWTSVRLPCRYPAQAGDDHASYTYHPWADLFCSDTAGGWQPAASRSGRRAGAGWGALLQLKEVTEKHHVAKWHSRCCPPCCWYRSVTSPAPLCCSCSEAGQRRPGGIPRLAAACRRAVPPPRHACQASCRRAPSEDPSGWR